MIVEFGFEYDYPIKPVNVYLYQTSFGFIAISEQILRIIIISSSSINLYYKCILYLSL